ncbi:methylase [Pyrenochaeta sp. MPI-SDFR-AT-0127]|nr:methylase [Pyrenochaeta sp. MPI-SDFR-AT-0127]
MAESTLTETPIYDRPSFFENYLQLPRQQHGLDGASEWPIMRAILGDLKEKRVLDLGCGLGWFARYAAAQGARHIDASDISTNMIEKAKSMTNEELQEKMKYEIQDLNTIELKSEEYDIVYSSLALHYLSKDSFIRLLQQIYGSLTSGGKFVFSCEHPIFTAPSNPAFLAASSSSGDEGHPVWPLTRYADEGVRRTDWMGGVVKYHRTLEGILGGLLEAGFAIKSVREWVARRADVKEGWDGEGSRPMFLIVGVEKV